MEAWAPRDAVGCTSPVSVVSQNKLVSGWGLKKWRSLLAIHPMGPCGLGRTFHSFPFHLCCDLTNLIAVNSLVSCWLAECNMQGCLHVVCEDSAAAGRHLGNMCSWLWSVGGNDWLQLPSVPALGRVCPRQHAGPWQCHWVPLLRSSCSGFAQLCSLHYNTQQCYSNITLCQVLLLLLCTFV